MVVNRENKLTVMLSDDEKTWLDELSNDAGVTMAEYLRNTIRDAHVGMARKGREGSTGKAKPVLSDRDLWLWRRIQKGGPLGEAVSIERIDHDARVEFGDDVVFFLGEMLTRLREAGYIRKAASGRDYEPVRKAPPDENAKAARGGK
jgi:hypothetical protein